MEEDLWKQKKRQHQLCQHRKYKQQRCRMTGAWIHMMSGMKLLHNMYHTVNMCRSHLQMRQKKVQAHGRSLRDLSMFIYNTYALACLPLTELN